MAGLIQFTKKGIYCPEADVYIDPWGSVDRALITHAHSDHARRGHKHYLCHHHSINVLKLRLSDINVQGVEYGKKVNIDGDYDYSLLDYKFYNGNNDEIRL